MPSSEQPTFDIRQCLGAGGFGEVYLAELHGVGPVALKVLHNGLDPRSQAVQRLRDEARLLALLDHPSILRIHDLFLLDGRVSLVTEYVDGQDLEYLLETRPGIAVPAGLEVLSHVASALQTAFTTIGPRGEPLRLLHRDIKPGNIRVGQDGSVKLLDFGIAKATGVTREAQTRTSGLLGSFAYMAPERFDPKQEDTPAGDVCSLGCVLFELLSGGDMLFGDYEIKDLFGLALVPERREQALDERLGTLVDVPPALLDLLREMLAHDARHRPELPDLSARLDALAGEVSGLRLKPWAQQYRWPAATNLPGGLTGKTLSGASLGTRSPSLPPPVPEVLGSLTGQTFQSESIQLDETGASEKPTSGPSGAPEPETLWTRTEDAKASEGALATFTPDGADPQGVDVLPGDGSDEVPPTRGKRGGLALFAVVALLVLGGSVGAGILVAGLGLYVGQQPSDPDVADERSDPPVPDAPAVEPRPVPDPTPGGVSPSPPTSTPRPVPGPVPDGVAVVPETPPGPETQPVPGPVPTLSEPDDGLSDVDVPQPVGTVATLEDCGDRTAIELAAQQGLLSADQQGCLLDGMRNASLKQTRRQEFGRNLLVELNARCDTGSGCARFEDLQREYFRDLGRSDPDMMANFALFLFRTANDRSERLKEVDTWATRALERKEQWSRSIYMRRTLEMHGVRGRAAYRRFELAPSDTTRDQAFQRTAEWAEKARQYNRDASEAMDLCASATGSRERCERRVTTEVAREQINFISLPMGARVAIDGKAHGTTPVAVPLVHGSHTVRMTLDDGSSEWTFTVGAGEAIQWQWRKEEDTWAAVY